MKTFKSPHDLNKLSPDDPAYPVIEDLISAYTWEGHPYNPDWYGYIILIEPDDVDRVLDELWEAALCSTSPGKASPCRTTSTSRSIWPTTNTDSASKFPTRTGSTANCGK